METSAPLHGIALMRALRLMLCNSFASNGGFISRQVHASSKTKVHKLTACLGMFGAHPSTCVAQERMADGDFRTAAWHCIDARFEAGAAAC